MNKIDLEIEEKNQNKTWIRNFSLSIVLHLLLLLLFIYLSGWQIDRSKVKANFFTIDTKEFIQQENNLRETNVDQKVIEKKTKPEKERIENTDQIKAISFSDLVADTTNLDQVYSESSLNVSIKYPKGWTFIDQNKKEKLDGVTFWENDGQINPPPYIHLEVVDKDMFIEKRYSYKMDLTKYSFYYNDPEEMQGYITQIIYIRTKDDEDFRLKLMMRGELEFKSFQPRFWAILKSFSFGSSIF